MVISNLQLEAFSGVIYGSWAHNIVVVSSNLETEVWLH